MNYRHLNSKIIKHLKNYHALFQRKFSVNNELLLTQCLKERTLLQISGNEASQYLQGLLTNDMKHLQEGAPSMFTMFLNSRGRVLFDSIIYNTDKENTFLIECDAEASSSLKQHITMYKVRRKIKIESLKDELEVWMIVNSKSLINMKDSVDYKKLINELQGKLQNSAIAPDPRLPCFGVRIITPKNYNLINVIQNNTSIKIQEGNFYKSLRYKLGVGEGVQELPPEKCLPLEANVDYLHGISFHKGCYIGQELTARTYHTGVIRKRLMPLVFEKEMEISEQGIPIYAVPDVNKSIGKLQGIEQTNGVGLLRIEEALKADKLVVLDGKCKTHRPFWWPAEAPKERLKIG